MNPVKTFAQATFVTMAAMSSMHSLAAESTTKDLRSETLAYLHADELAQINHGDMVQWCPVSCGISCAASCVGSTASVGQPNCT